MRNITFLLQPFERKRECVNFSLYRKTKKSIRLNIFDSEDFQVSLLIEDFLDDLLVSRPEDFNIFNGKLKYF